jgi:uncharacterized membrane protein
VFLILATAFGSACLLVTPPCQVPDEAFHFDRAFQISEGHIISLKQEDQAGDYLPRGVAHFRQVFDRLERRTEQKTSAAEIRAALSLAIDDDRVFAGFPNTAVYPPLAYLPQALGIALARLFSPSVLVCFYAGRVGNLLAATALFFLAIRVAPVGKWALVVLALTPMALFETASLSCDALTNAFSFLLVAFVLRCACGPVERIAFRDVVVLALLVTALALVKQGYLLLVLAYFLIPRQRLGGWKRYLGVFVLLVGCELLAAGTWALAVRNVYSPAVSGKIDPQAQLGYVLAHPNEFLLIILRSSTVDAPGTLREYLGVLGILDTPLPDYLLLLEGLVLIVTALLAFGPSGAVTGRQAFVALAAALATYLSILTAIHLTWDKVGSTTSIDVQGRYYIPLGPLLAVGLGWLGQRLPACLARVKAATPILAAAAVSCLLSLALAALYQRYFVDSPVAAAERQYDRGQEILKQGGSKQEAQDLFEEALRLNPEHAGAHFNLGVLLAARRPREAIAHYREAARLEPNNLQAHNNLANALARQGLFEEAIEHYQKALHIAPEDGTTQRNLEYAQRSQELLRRSLQRIATVIQGCARDGMIDTRSAGPAGEGPYLKPSCGEVLTAAGTPPLPQMRYVWRIPPPSGERMRAPSDAPGRLDERGSRPFYACSVDLVGFRRIFVFPPPVKAVILEDEDVSWFYQLPMDVLRPQEQAREREYRGQQGLKFPRDLRLPPPGKASS